MPIKSTVQKCAYSEGILYREDFSFRRLLQVAPTLSNTVLLLLDRNSSGCSPNLSTPVCPFTVPDYGYVSKSLE